jgi:bleomycin hydrolase
MKMNKVFSVTLVLSMMIGSSLFVAAQGDSEKKGYEFTIDKSLPATPVENQYRSSTCWSFATISFLESELLRMDKGQFNLSEMYIVYNTYLDKAKGYVRWQGNINFAGGGAFHDVIEVIREHGIIPDQVYSGKVIGEENHVHGEMDAVLKGYMEALIKNRNKKLTGVWQEGLRGILDAYLGEIPERFIFSGKEYSPLSFAAELGLNMDDYVEIGSYTHHPFYEEFILEVPDNWMMGQIYNVPLEEMMEIIDYAIENGYTVGWGADVSEKGFSWKNGVAIVPAVDLEDLTGTEREKWEKLTEEERSKMMYSFEGPVPEKTITQEMRQEGFNSYQTTDDHGMHITGTAHDQEGNRYYLVKNSWGTKGNDYEGYFYASRAYVALKTIDLVVHKEAVPEGLREKLGY